jgi:hypothetical protein
LNVIGWRMIAAVRIEPSLTSPSAPLIRSGKAYRAIAAELAHGRASQRRTSRWYRAQDDLVERIEQIKRNFEEH